MIDEKVIVLKHYPEGKSEKKRQLDVEIFAIISGSIKLSSPLTEQKKIEKNYFVFLLPGVSYEIYFSEPTTLIIFDIRQDFDFYTLMMAYQKNEEYTGKKNQEFSYINIKRYLKYFMETVGVYLNNDLFNPELTEIKMKEFFHLMRKNYTVAELTNFFQPIISTNIPFTYFILKNYREVKTVKEFAEKSKLSQSGFEKEFRKVFHTSPYRWMKKKRMDLLFHEITQSTKPFKVISEECGFSSTSQMSDYCKKEWGYPPGKIRTKHKNNL